MIQVSKSVFDKLTLVPRPDGQPGEWREGLGSPSEGGARYCVQGDDNLVALSDDVNDCYYLQEVRA